METPPTNPTPHSIAPDLLEQLDAANRRFHEARQHLEEVMDGSEYRHQERIDEKNEELRNAERALEEITAKIKEALAPPAK
jgi:predicted  nucleic acid-binding Zn-ribbon protein